MNVGYVICCNDSVEAVVVDDEKLAKKELERLAKKHYDSFFELTHPMETYVAYRRQHYWHIHSVPILVGE